MYLAPQQGRAVSSILPMGELWHERLNDLPKATQEDSGEVGARTWSPLSPIDTCMGRGVRKYLHPKVILDYVFLL